MLPFLPLISAGIGAVGNIAGNAIGSSLSLKAVREQNQANMELAKYQYDRNLEMWNLQNEYNTPANQMQRFKDAGLNPNLMYGQGNPGNADQAPKFEAPTMQAYTGFGDLGLGRAASMVAEGIQTYKDFELKDAQIDQIRQNTINLETNNELNALKVIFQGLQNAKSEKEVAIYDDILQSVLSNRDSQTALNNSRKEGQDLLNQKTELLMPYVIPQAEADLQNALKDLKVKDWKIKDIQSSINYRTLLGKIAGLRADLLSLEYTYDKNTLYNREHLLRLKERREDVELYFRELLRDRGIKLDDGDITHVLGRLFERGVDTIEGDVENDNYSFISPLMLILNRFKK